MLLRCHKCTGGVFYNLSHYIYQPYYRRLNKFSISCNYFTNSIVIKLK